MKQAVVRLSQDIFAHVKHIRIKMLNSLPLQTAAAIKNSIKNPQHQANIKDVDPRTLLENGNNIFKYILANIATNFWQEFSENLGD